MSEADNEQPLSEVDLDAIVEEWWTVEQAADYLGVTPATVKTMIRTQELTSAPGTKGGIAASLLPAALFDDGWTVKGVHGVLTLLHDAGYEDAECVAWLFIDRPDLPGRAIDALRENRGREVKRRAQALGF